MTTRPPAFSSAIFLFNVVRLDRNSDAMTPGGPLSKSLPRSSTNNRLRLRMSARRREPDDYIHPGLSPVTIAPSTPACSRRFMWMWLVMKTPICTSRLCAKTFGIVGPKCAAMSRCKRSEACATIAALCGHSLRHLFDHVGMPRALPGKHEYQRTRCHGHNPNDLRSL